MGLREIVDLCRIPGTGGVGFYGREKGMHPFDICIGAVVVKVMQVRQCIVHADCIVELLSRGKPWLQGFCVQVPHPRAGLEINRAPPDDKIVVRVTSLHVKARRAFSYAILHQSWREPDDFLFKVHVTTGFIEQVK